MRNMESIKFFYSAGKWNLSIFDSLTNIRCKILVRHPFLDIEGDSFILLFFSHLRKLLSKRYQHEHRSFYFSGCYSNSPFYSLGIEEFFSLFFITFLFEIDGMDQKGSAISVSILKLYRIVKDCLSQPICEQSFGGNDAEGFFLGGRQVCQQLPIVANKIEQITER